MTEDELAAQILAFLERQDRFSNFLAQWTGGVAGGGPNGDGKYPLPISATQTQLVACPAQIQVDSSRSRVSRKTLASGQGNTIFLTEADNGLIISVLGQTSTTSINVQVPADVPAGWSCIIIQEATGGPRVTINMGTNSAGTTGTLKSRGSVFRLADEGAVASLVCTRREGSPGRSTVILAGDLVQ